MPIYSADKMYVAYGIGIDIDTTFRNNDAALAVAEIQATDKLDGNKNALVDYSDPEVEEVGHMSSSQFKTQLTTGYRKAKVSLPSYLQTGVGLYATLGTCVTSGTYLHTISLNPLQTPIYFGLHLEKELTGQDLRHDFLGYMPVSWNVNCSENAFNWKARQTFAGEFAYSRPTGGDLLEPSKQSLSIYEWSDLKHGSGALDAVYNSNPLGFDIRGFDLTVRRTNPLWGALDATSKPEAANIAGVGIELLLEGYLKGNNVRTIMQTKPEDYAGALDIDIDFYKSAARDFDINLDYLYLVPDQSILSESEWYEKKTLRFIPLDHNTVISALTNDSLDKTYYEND